ncbi:MAG: DNA mismatch repair endonuclease MutL [Bacteroidales bacterium]|nr:DNA mismatch repair endonuclease MutL [Bacteroidales bacterium]
MARLQVLPPELSNMIAAGEVVQRPASVVKELMENAVDAGATQVTVVIADSGRTLIQVIDNGSGMSPEDAVLCFERHATSKIATADDLSDILTYGFRGEALASIAAVADITLKTRRAEDESAFQVNIEGYNKFSTCETAAPVGSNFAVRNLFYNTPARRKFLKSDNIELKHIVAEFTRIALTRPEIGFQLTHNGRDLYVLKPAKSLKYRLLDMFGNPAADELVDIFAQTSVITVSGFVGRPDTARKTVGNQFFFVNGRYFRSPYLHKAVMKAYEEFIPEGATPSYFLYLEVDPHAIDVNISPTKTEIKFEDDAVIFQTLYACVRETLGKHAFGGSIDFETAAEVPIPALTRSFEQFHPASAPATRPDPSFDPFDPSTFDTPAAGSAPREASDPSRFVDKSQNYGKLFEDKTLPSTQILLLQGKYIVVPAKSGLMVVHVRRARERILYDRFLRALAKNEHVVQTSLFPVQVKVGVENRLLFDENAELLATLGFDISPFGTDTLVVNGVPEGCSGDGGSVRTMVSELMLILSEDRNSLKEAMESARAAKFAVLGAASAPAVSSPFEAQRLIDRLLACDNAEFTSGGRRIIAIFDLDTIDKKF